MNNCIFLLGMPRSGTTWLSQVFESSPDFIVRLSPLFSWEFRGKIDSHSSSADWLRLLGRCAHTDDPFMTQNWRRFGGELPDFQKEPSLNMTLAIKDTRFHDLYRGAMDLLPQALAVCIVRHPAAALWSWRNCKEFPKGADFSNEWRNGRCRKDEGLGEYWGFEDWKLTTELWLDAQETLGRRVIIVRYEDLLNRSIDDFEKLFCEIGKNFHSSTADFIRESRSRNDESPYSVYKTKSPYDWRDAFPKSILSTIEQELIGTRLERFIL